MMDFWNNPAGALMEKFAPSGMTIALGVAAVAGLVMLLGMAKKLAALMLTGSLNAGHALATKLAEKPKAVMLGLGVFALAVTSLWAWRTFTAPKIVEREVVRTVTVKDYSGVSDLQKELTDLQRARVDAENRAATEHNKAASAENRLTGTEKALKQAEEQIAALANRLHQLSPAEGDDKALERLAKQIDSLHAEDVAQQAATIGQSTRQQYVGQDDSFLRQSVYVTVPNPYGDSGRYRQYGHKYFSPATSVTSAHLSNSDTYYHRSCSICDHNCRIRQRMDEIYERLAAAEPANARLRDAAAKIKKRMDRAHLNVVSREARRDTSDEDKYFQ